MQDCASHSGDQLLMTGGPAGDQDPRCSVLLGLPHLGKQVRSYCHTEVVVIALVAEASCHTAALNRGQGDIKSSSAQQVNGLRGGVARPLLTVRVVEELCPEMRFVRWEYMGEVNSLLLCDVPDELKRFKTVRSKGGDRGLIVKQIFAVEAEHGEHTGFDDRDLSAAV